MIDAEYRAFPLEEFRADGDGAARKISGYAAVFNKRSAPMFGMVEQIAPGAFTKTLKSADVRALWNHNPLYVLGRSSAGTLRLEEDERGLKIENDPPDTQWARDLLVSIERRDIREMSFGFRVTQGGDEWKQDGKTLLRTIREVELVDVSPVTFPAYPAAKLTLRSFEDMAESLAEEGRRRLADNGTDGWENEIERQRRRLDLRSRI